ncbi:MAG: hypothetical protein V4503_09895 [Gemmatimonadota bacterium]
MTQRNLLTSLAFLSLLAACGKTDSGDAGVDSVLAVAPPAAAPTPHIVGFDLGRQVEAGGGIVGGTTDLFTVGDTIVVAVRAQYTKDGDAVSARLLKGSATVDSISATLPAADSTGIATATMRFAQAKAWPAGSYRVESFLGTESQGIKEITIK